MQRIARLIIGCPRCSEAEVATTLLRIRDRRSLWAAAPYLHNGSVASLAELLKPASQRQQRFAIGPDYDVNNIGIALNQTQAGNVRETTGCDDLNSGNSRCGHEFGTSLPDADKKALLEYLKTL